MKYLIALALLAAVTSAEESKIELKALPFAFPYSGFGAHPYSWGYHHALPYGYAAPFRYAAAPVVTAYTATVATPAVTVAAPAPITYATGAKIESTYEPVEQHGYRIAY